MIKKTLIWKDFNGGEHMEDFYFHLYKPDMVDLEVSKSGGLSAMLPKLIASNDMGEVVRDLQETYQDVPRDPVSGRGQVHKAQS